jgi:hypothetical protein
MDIQEYITNLRTRAKLFADARNEKLLIAIAKMKEEKSDG